MTIVFGNPSFLYALLPLLLLILLAVFRSRRSLLSLVLRFIAFAALIVALADPYVTDKKESKNEKHVLALIDYSKSMPERAIESCNKQVDIAASKIGEIKKFKFSDKLKDSDQEINDTELTNYELVMSQAISKFPGSALIICTDGQETTGNVLGLSRKISENFQSISVIFPDTTNTLNKNVEVTNTTLPLEAKSSDTIPISFSLKNKTNSDYNEELEITSDSKPLKQIQVNVKNLEEKKFELSLDKLEKGEHKISIRDKSGNLLKSKWIKINEPPYVLVISKAESSGVLIEKILTSLKINFKTKDPKDVMLSEKENSFYSGIILNNVRASDLGGQTQNEIARFVENNAGLLILGGDSSFGLGGYQKTVLDNISPLKSVPPRSKVARAPSAVMLVVDKSGSMGEQGKLHSAKLAALSSIYSLKPNDYVGMIGFDYAPLSIIEIDVAEKVRLSAKERLANLSAYGQTNLLPALSLARLRLSKLSAGKKHVIILSDGQFPAQSDSFVAEINRLRAEGITVSTVALGYEADGPFMKMLAQAGKGSFYQTVDASSLPKLFVDDIKLAVGEDTMKEDSSFSVNLGKDGGDLSRFGIPPSILGFIETESKENAKLELTVSKQETLFPLMASWNYGKGRVTAFASDLQGRWTSPWVRWAEFLSFWENVLRKTLKSENQETNNKNLDLRYEVVGRRLKLEAFIYDQYLENSIGSAIATEISYQGKTIEKLSLNEKAKGRFENSINLSEPGDYDIILGLDKKRSYKIAILANELGETSKGVNFEFLNNLSTSIGAKLGTVELKSSTKKDKILFYRSKPYTLELLVFAILIIISEVYFREKVKKL